MFLDDNPASALGISSLAELPTAEENFSESDDSEKEDDVIKPTDNLILVGHVEGDASILEVHSMFYKTFFLPKWHFIFFSI